MSAAEDPDLDLKNKMLELDGAILAVQREIKILEGKILNRKSANPAVAEKQCKELGERGQMLEEICWKVAVESERAKTEDELKIQREVLRKSAVEHFKALNIDSELWKNIEF